MKAPTIGNEKAYTSNYPDLQKWLDDREARCNWQLLRGRLDSHHEHVESWSIGAHQFIVVVRSHHLGWDVYTACGDIRVDETFADAERRLRLTPASSGDSANEERKEKA